MRTERLYDQGGVGDLDYLMAYQALYEGYYIMDSFGCVFRVGGNTAFDWLEEGSESRPWKKFKGLLRNGDGYHLARINGKRRFTNNVHGMKDMPYFLIVAYKDERKED